MELELVVATDVVDDDMEGMAHERGGSPVAGVMRQSVKRKPQWRGGDRESNNSNSDGDRQQLRSRVRLSRLPPPLSPAGFLSPSLHVTITTTTTTTTTTTPAATTHVIKRLKLLPSSPLCRIKVMTLSGKLMEFEVSSDETVQQIKELIEEVEGIPPEQQRLIFDGRTMADTERITQCNGCTLHLVFALRGG